MREFDLHTKVQLDILRSREMDYTANDEVRRKNGNKVLSLVLGPTGIGKSTIINNVLKQRRDWALVGSTLTREHRKGDPKNYRTAKHGVTHDRMIAWIADKELVNYSIPPSLEVYGTHPDDVPGLINLFPVLPSSIPSLQAAGFERVIQSTIVAPVEDWQRWLDKRSQDTDHVFERMQEAVSNITYSLEHQDDLNIIVNSSGKNGRRQAAHELELVSNGEAPYDMLGSERVRRLDMLQRMQQFAVMQVAKAA